MIVNIYGPSGSGKTTFIRNLLRSGLTNHFLEKYANINIEENLNKRISISLIPIPLFRGTVEEFFNIFCLNIKILLVLNKELSSLAQSIFKKINNDTLEQIASRKIETLSAGEIRRLFLLKSILVDSEIMIIDEPFSNSDEKLWGEIYKAINIKQRSIILSHLSLEKFFNSNKKNISIQIKDIKMNFNKS